MNYAKLVILLWCITFSVEELCTINGSTEHVCQLQNVGNIQEVHTEDIVEEEMTFNVAPMQNVTMEKEIVFLKKDVVERS